MQPGAQDICFVIPVRNGATLLPRCLRSIQTAGAGRGGVEIVVVDNGSTDDSAAVASRHGARVVGGAGLRVGALRNAGARATSAPLLAFVDADHELAPGWIDRCRAALSAHGVGAAGRQYDAPHPGTWVQRAYACLREHSPAPRDVEWLGAGNLAVWRHVFEAVGGFDESLEACEDVDLCRVIRLRGWRVVSEPGMRSIHHGDPATLGAVFRGERWRARDNLRVSLRGRPSWRSAWSVVMPLATLTLLAAAVAATAAVPWLGPWPAAVSVLSLSAVVLLRAGVMIARGGVETAGGWLGCVAVAATYECARAVSPIMKATHASRARGVA